MKLYFMHIPKTGGMSLHAMLSKHFHAEEICPERHYPAALIPPGEAQKYRFFSAHAPYDLFLRLPKPAKIVTVFREPVARIISAYFFLRRFAIPDIHPRIARELSFSQFLNWDNRYFQEEQSNQTAGFLCGHKYLNPDGIPWRSKSEILDVGFARIESMDFVGITEFMQESVARMWPAIGFKGEPRMLTINARSEAESEADRAEVTPKIVARIEELNQIDIELYKFARKRFLDQRVIPKPHEHQSSGNSFSARDR